MNLLPRLLTEWLKEQIGQFTIFGVRSVMKESAAQFASDVMRANQAATRVGSEGIDLADELGASGIAAKRKIAELLERGTLETLTLMNEVTSGRMSIDEGREALDEVPFTASSATSLPAFDAEPQAIEHQPQDPGVAPEGPDPAPAKKRRGRPRKHPMP